VIREAVRKRTTVATDGFPRRVASPVVRGGPPGVGWRVADAILAVSLLAGVVIAGNLDRMPQGLEGFLGIRLSVKNVLLLTAFGFAWPAVLGACGLYLPARLREGQGEWPRLLLASLIGGMLAMVFPLTSRSGAVRPVHILLFAAAVSPLSAALRETFRAVRRSRRGTHTRQVLLVGSGPLAVRARRGLQSNPGGPVEIIGFVDTRPQSSAAMAGVPHLGRLEELEQVLMHRIVDEVFVGLPIKSHYEEIQRTFAACERVGVPAKYPTDIFWTALSPGVIEQETAAPMLAVSVAQDPYRLAFKRALDIGGSALLLVVLAPVLAAIAAAIKLTSPGPVLFAQERYGYMKRRFRMQKFRTMVVEAERLQATLEQWNEASGPIFKIRNDPRITRVGRLLRRSSLDELPQLWHVLTGEMSLVGPRPMSSRDVSRFEDPWLMRRFSVRPGLTGLWQVSGRSELGFEQWIRLDLEYIDQWSLWLDWQIVLKTIPAVLKGTGAQ